MKTLFIFMSLNLVTVVCRAGGIDPYLEKSWGMDNVSASRAWTIHSGSKKVVVAVIDTGIDVSHPDLKENIWINSGEVPGNGIDDDRNGFVDDVNGWNFIDNNNDVTDHHGHGTHVAGIIGARGGNGLGTSGVSAKVSLMALKYFDPSSPEADNLLNTIKAIRYATLMNANVINYSGGGFSRSSFEEQAIREASHKGIVFVAAAGNERTNSDQFGFYPASYGLPNVVAVTAIDGDRKFLSTSNFGARSVHVAAPGKAIYSTLPHRKYGLMTGTSQATAFISGVAALMIASGTNSRTPQELIYAIQLTGDFSGQLSGRTLAETSVNAYQALTMRDRQLAANNKFQEKGNPILQPEVLFDSRQSVAQIVQAGRALSQFFHRQPVERRPSATRAPKPLR